MSDDISNSVWNSPLGADESVYPFNHVTKTVGGHIFEVDDTLGAERIHRQHKSGSYETFDSSGGRVLHITGSGYTMIVKDDNITVGGSVNLTIAGDCNTTVLGNYNLHVEGNMNETVRGIKRTKVGGNRLSEVGGDDAVNVSGKISSTATNKSETINGASTITSGTTNQTINGDLQNMVTGNSVQICGQSAAIVSTVGLTLGSMGFINIGSTVVNSSGFLNHTGPASILGAVSITGAVGVTGIVTTTNTFAGLVSLRGHTHTETGEITLFPIGGGLP
jgi:hypothetical protein